MFNLIFAARFDIWSVDLWYAVPAIIAVSLVYSATRHEQMRPILVHTGRVILWFASFMLIAFVAIQLLCHFQ
jgi:hypothetical protein